jgi:hypothetical protein
LIVTLHNAIASIPFGIVAAYNQIATRYKAIVLARFCFVVADNAIVR